MKRLTLITLLFCCIGFQNAEGKLKGPKEAFSFVQFTDPQFGFMDNAGTCSLFPEKEQMEKVVSILKYRKPAFTICTGDFIHLTHNDSATKVYEDYIETIRACGTKVYMVPGNHDLPKVDEQHLTYYRQHYGEDRWAFKYRNCAFIGLNSRKCKYKFVFMHIAFFIHDMDEKEQYFNQPLSIREKYLKLLEGYGVQAVFCGHLHQNAYAKYHDIEIVTSNAVGRDLSGENKHGMTLIEVTPTGYRHKYMELDDPKWRNP